MTTLTAAKVITPIVTRDNGRVEIEYQAEFDGQTIGFFPTYLAAEEALNDHAMRLIEDGLVDLPLTLLAADPESPDPGPQPWEGPTIPRADWGAWANGSIYTCGCGKGAYTLLHGAHDTLDIALCVTCDAAYQASA